MKKMIAVAAVAASATIPMAANADTIVTQTINNVEWRFQLNPTAGTATLGLGADKEASWACPKIALDAAEIPWTFIGDDGVSYKVTAIANNAFKQHTQLTGTLTIPVAVKTIGTSAFQKIGDSLTRLVWSGGVTTMGNYVFEEDASMAASDIDLSGLTSIGEGPFNRCSKLTGQLKLGDSLTTISRLSFANTAFSGTAVIPESVTSMGHNTNYGVFSGSSNFSAIWVKGMPVAASQSYTTVYCAKFAASCSSMKLILMGQNTKGARMTQTGSNAMLYGCTGVQVFVPANGYWDGLVTGGTNNKVWYYGPTNEFNLVVDDDKMRATFTPTTIESFTNALAWASSFKEHFDLEPRINVTNTIDLTDVTITEQMVSDVTFDRLMFTAKTQTQLNAILDAFPATTPISIDPTGLTENMVIPNDYPNVHVKTVPGVTIRRTASGFMIIVK